MKILDCTLRDGGYYTNWDFPKELINTYFRSFNSLPVEYLEIGYRSKPMKEYLGEYFYCPLYVIENIKKTCNKKLVVIVDEKDIRPGDIDSVLKPCIGLIDMVRMAIDPKNFKRALVLAEAVKKLGFEVGFNVMYMSNWPSQKEFLGQIKEVNGLADYFYMVDSYGGVYPEDIKNIYELVKSQCSTQIGFHGHNNLEFALINSLTAIDCGVDIVDATVTGMGRGAGNLKTELLLTALNAKGKIDFDFNALSNVVDGFSNLQKKYDWGTNLPYMVSGANSLPQKNVMEWVTKRYYSFNSIIRALQNQRAGVEDNQRFNLFEPTEKFLKALLIGGGPSALKHADAVKEYIKTHENICIVHASSKNAQPYSDINIPQYFCLAGSEGHRLQAVLGNFKEFKGRCLLPPYPRKMGTYVPDKVACDTFEIKQVNFTKMLDDSHTSLALQACVDLGAIDVFVIGYDGYSEGNSGVKEQELFMENEQLFNDAHAFGLNLHTITPSRYKNLSVDSIYARIG